MTEPPVNPRYVVVKGTHGHSIIDTTGKEKAYTIELPPLEHYAEGRAPKDKSQAEDFNGQICEGWALVWNRVDAGCCGVCGNQLAEDEQRYTATGMHALYRVVCEGCAATLGEK